MPANDRVISKQATLQQSLFVTKPLLAVVADLSGQKVTFNRTLGLIYYTCLLVFSSQLVDSVDVVHAGPNNAMDVYYYAIQI
jgi:hypothetical protein